jgi:DNA-binding response OmpR family regulator
MSSSLEGLAPQPGGRAAVLVIDDEDTLARNLARYLGRHGYAVRTAGSAEAGLAELANFRPDVVLLDHNLPGLCGLDAIEPIKRGHPRRHVLLMTGFGDAALLGVALARGADDCLTKPLALADVRERLEALAARA